MAKNILIMGAAGKDFHVINPCYREDRDGLVERPMLPSSKPVMAVVAVRTGCGKSQTSRKPDLRVTHDLADEGPEFLAAIEKAIAARKGKPQ